MIFFHYDKSMDDVIGYSRLQDFGNELCGSLESEGS